MTLLIGGENDVIFPAPGARAYLRDLPGAELHLLDTGHFALEDHVEEIARLGNRVAATSAGGIADACGDARAARVDDL